MSQNPHEIVIFENGAASVRNTALNEAMHSSVGPEKEAEIVYLRQARLAERLAEPAARGTLVLYDVGLGIASNALAAIECARRLPGSRELHLLSFESDLSGLRLALENLDRFPRLREHEAALRELLDRRIWNDGKIRWELREGDFLAQSLTPAPEVVFYDFYSPKVAPQLWGLQAFRKLFEACEPRRQRDQGSLLATYSVATPVRVAMLLAGFAVGHGTSTEAKLETTVASTLRSELARPLGEEWLQRFQRSQRPLPVDIPQSGLEEVRQRITRIILS